MVEEIRERHCREYHASQRKEYNEKRQKKEDDSHIWSLMLGFELALYLAGHQALSEELSELRQ